MRLAYHDSSAWRTKSRAAASTMRALAGVPGPFSSINHEAEAPRVT